MDKNIPFQHSGAESNIEQTVSFKDELSAADFFTTCCQRLLDVNNWHQLAGEPSAVFQLHDRSGVHLQKQAEKGDLFRIELPVSNKGKYDWVEIEEIQKSTNDNNEQLCMRVRPTHAPDQNAETVEHFFNPDASSSFIVERNGLEVKAGIYGRNEKPNIKNAEGITEALRNTFIAIGAIVALSRIQWKKLVEGIINVP